MMSQPITGPTGPGAPGYGSAVIEYFAEKASAYDRVDEQIYWRLSDELLWEAIIRYAIPHLPDAPHILDAGGGTGRWTDRFLRQIPDATCTLVDLSPEMTEVAREKAMKSTYMDRLSVIVRDLAELESVCPAGSVDLAISFHNVLGFVTDPLRVIASMSRSLRQGGLMCLFVPNVHHGVFFNLSIGADDVAQSIAEHGLGSFTRTMPNMHFFTPETLEEAVTDSGCIIEVLCGSPVYVYPGFAETQIEGTSDRLKSLSDDRLYAATLALEKAALGERTLASRGNNLLVVARRA